MEKALLNLFDLLFVHKQIYSDLLDLSISKKDTLVNSNVGELENIINAEQVLLMRLGEVEKERCAAVRELAGKLNIPEGEINFDYIISIADESKKQELIKLKEDFTRVLEDITKYNEINAKLIRTHLDYIAYSFDALSGVKKTTDYNKNGDINENKFCENKIIDKNI